MKQVFALVSLFLFIAACNNPAQQTQANRYYDVAGYIQRQIDTLAQRKPTVIKRLLVEGQVNQKRVDDINWIKELELFLQADINKPAYRNSYLISKPDSLTVQYKLKAGEKLPVHALTVVLDSLYQKPSRIEALLVTDNPLYQSERRLLLESSVSPDQKWQLNHYRIDGFQQLTFFDRKDFSVEGRVLSRQ
ncbi:hypothetical protein GCM10023189_54640 [Nibrella saemangeumensis]|uniref:Uncharacterized protein n=1 Tax=Nibrella saemangeumensis TaxID=1084526 RepID=A0ABP8NKJ0_9BACT